MAKIAEGGGQDADDLVRLPVDADRAAENVGGAAEAGLPVVVADDENVVAAVDLFVATEGAAELRPGAERRKKVGGSAKALGHLRRPARLGNADLGEGVRGDLAVAAYLGPQIEVVGRRNTAAGVVGGGAEDALQPIPVGVRRRPQQVGVEGAEHRRVGADAEPERDDGDESESRSPTQRLDGEAEVTEYCEPA